jgi:hypothetical protein
VAVAVDASGNVAVVDEESNAIRLLTPTGTEPVLTIQSAHAGAFTQGQAGVVYTLTPSNAAGAGPTSGTVTLTEVPPAGFTLVSMAGTGWTCTSLPVCTRSDALSGGSSYPAVTVTVNVSPAAPGQLTNEAGVSAGGAATAGRVTDLTVITAYSGAPSVSIDTPAANATLSGTTAIGGWALENTSVVGPNAVSSVTVLVDGGQVGTATYGGPRPDICSVFSGRSGCPNVGWNYNLSVSSLTAGSHTLQIVATDTAGFAGSSTVTFNVISAP